MIPHFSNIEGFHLFWFVPGVVLLFIYAHIKRNQALSLFADTGILKKINISIKNSRRIIKLILFCLGVLFLVIAIARPDGNPKQVVVQSRGRDVVFLLDVSKSMLAEDLSQSRLDKAKQAIKDCVEVLEGDRVALVVFAGNAVLKCPLILNKRFFSSAVDKISVNSVSRGGTNIGDAIRMVTKEVFDDLEKKHKDIILITDGEDHDTAPELAAEEAGKRGIRILAIGLGDENTGRRIPVTNEQGNKTFMTYTDRDGKVQEVWTRLDADMLRKIANLSAGGNYLNVATGNFDLGTIYKQLISTAEKKEQESAVTEEYEEWFQFPLILALIFLIAEMAIGIRTPRRRTS